MIYFWKVHTFECHLEIFGDGLERTTSANDLDTQDLTLRILGLLLWKTNKQNDVTTKTKKNRLLTELLSKENGYTNDEFYPSYGCRGPSNNLYISEVGVGSRRLSLRSQILRGVHYMEIQSFCV